MLAPGMPPIRKALVALLLSSAVLLLCFRPSDAGAAPERGKRPAAALVTSSESGLRPHGSERLSPLGLVALVAAGWVPALVLLTRRRRHRSLVE
jgi:hypothetical protein